MQCETPDQEETTDEEETAKQANCQAGMTGLSPERLTILPNIPKAKELQPAIPPAMLAGTQVAAS